MSTQTRSEETRLVSARAALASVDQLLTEAGFTPDSSARHQLSIARSLISQETHMRTRVPMTREDEAIFDRRHDSMDAQWLYEDAQERDYERMLWIMRAGIRHDLASPAVRIEG